MQPKYVTSAKNASSSTTLNKNNQNLVKNQTFAIFDLKHFEKTKKCIKILTKRGFMKKEDCIFCKIVDGKLPSYKIFENEFVYAFLDISKDCYGHTLVVPKNHHENVMDCPDKDLNQVIKAVKKISNHYVNNCGINAVNILNNSGIEAQQTVMHLHFHIFPRKCATEFDCYPALKGIDVELEKQLEHLKLEN